MPQPAEQKYRHDIEAPAGQAPPAPAQGDVHVVGKPGRQADVPPPPELPDGAGGIGGLEIFHQLHAQKPCRPPGDVGVAGKVTIDLQTKQRRGGDDLRAGRLAGGGVHRVHQGGEAVGDGRLFEIARQQQPSARGKLLPGQGPLPAQLGQQAAGALDGPGHQLGEKGDEQRVIAEVPLRGGPAPVYVQHVGQGLEGVKGDAQPPCGAAMDQPGEKARVFEHAQAAQAGAQRHRQAGPSDGRGLFPGRAQPAQPGGRSYGHQQQPRHRLPPEVKQPAGRQQQRPAQPVGQGPVERQHGREEQQEFQGVEIHFPSPFRQRPPKAMAAAVSARGSASPSVRPWSRASSTHPAMHRTDSGAHTGDSFLWSTVRTAKSAAPAAPAHQRPGESKSSAI